MEMLRIADALLVVAGLRVAVAHTGIDWSNEYLATGLVHVLMFYLGAQRWAVYRSWRAANMFEEAYRVGACWITTATALAAALYLIESNLLVDRDLLIAWAIGSLGLLVVTRLGVRIALRELRRRGGNFRTAAIVGANPVGQRIAELLQENRWMGIRLLGIYDDRRGAGERTIADRAPDGHLDDLRELMAQGHVDIVYISLPLRAELRILQLVREFQECSASVQFVADFSAFGLVNGRWEMLGGLPTLKLVETPHQGIDGLMKRTIDIVGSLAAVVIFAIPMAVIALAIKLESPGPALFRQIRYGLDGRAFEIYKFRTMTTLERDSAKFVQATRGDRRVTRLGALLRRTSLDELPQFINVLQGRMSIVGPRPHPRALDEAHRQTIEGYVLRHKVRPGITGWAQVNGCRGETDTPEKMLNRIQYDLQYIREWSIWLDLRIIWQTVFRVFRDPQAY